MSHIEQVLWAGLAIGLIFGATGQITGFCLQRGLKEWWSRSGGYKLHAFAFALAVALGGTQALAAYGLIDLDATLYRMPTGSWLLVPAGGLMFGYGMGLANGCGARALVLLGQGNLRSLLVLACIGIAAYVTLTGVLAPLRMAISERTTIQPSAVGPSLGAMSLTIAALMAATLLAFALRGRGAGRRRADLLGGLVVGTLIVAGWLVTGVVGADDFEPVPLGSLTFVAPIGDFLQYAMIATGMSPRFGIAVVAGVVAGAFVTALLRRQYRLEGFDTPGHMLRHMGGGVLMGVGGALALGCSIGQGLTGISTLSYSSLVAGLSIVAGARLAWRRNAIAVANDTASATRHVA